MDDQLTTSTSSVTTIPRRGLQELIAGTFQALHHAAVIVATPTETPPPLLRDTPANGTASGCNDRKPAQRRCANTNRAGQHDASHKTKPATTQGVADPATPAKPKHRE